MRPTWLFFAFFASFLLFVVACGSEDETVCDPGSGVFCRCLDGGPGQKRCSDDGLSFGECLSQNSGLACEESDSSGTGSSTSSGTGSGGSKKLLEACKKNSECKSGTCSMGYCTKDCAQFSDCAEFGGDCVQVEGKVQQCAPYCFSWQDCEEFGESSLCSYATAVDAYGVSICADWTKVAVPPDGSGCRDDLQCHLGYAGMQRVCEFSKCLTGCHQEDDCPDGFTCSDGMPGQCM